MRTIKQPESTTLPLGWSYDDIHYNRGGDLIEAVKGEARGQYGYRVFLMDPEGAAHVIIENTPQQIAKSCELFAQAWEEEHAKSPREQLRTIYKNWPHHHYVDMEKAIELIMKVMFENG